MQREGKRSSAIMKLLHCSVLFLVVTVHHIHGFWIFLPDKGTDRSSNVNIKTPVVLGKRAIDIGPVKF